MSILSYTIFSVFIVSLISLIGVFTLGLKVENLKKILIYLISFSAGALLGDVFIHLIPETVKSGFTLLTSLYILFGIILFFALEKIVRWRHCHMPITKQHVHPFAYMSLFGDALHNSIDGMAIAASYIISIPVGIATTLAVIFHEIPQEIGNFGILVHGGFSKQKALFINFLTALTAFLGAFVAFWLSSLVNNVELFFIPLTIGGFIYVAGSDLIPELHKENEIKQAFFQLVAFLAGILIMLALILLG